MIPVLTVIAQLVRGLAAYWELKAKRLWLDEAEKLEKETDEIQAQIEDMYRRGDYAGAHRLLVAKARRASILEGLVDPTARGDVHQPGIEDRTLGERGGNSGEGRVDPVAATGASQKGT